MRRRSGLVSFRHRRGSYEGDLGLKALHRCGDRFQFASDPDKRGLDDVVYVRVHLRLPFAGLRLAFRYLSDKHIGYLKVTAMTLSKKNIKRGPLVSKVTLTEAEKSVLTKAARQAGVPLATYLRLAALEKAQKG